MSQPIPCWLVVRYVTFQERYLHAICTSPDSAITRKEAVERYCDLGVSGCRSGHKVYIEQSQLDHLLGDVMSSG